MKLPVPTARGGGPPWPSRALPWTCHGIRVTAIWLVPGGTMAWTADGESSLRGAR